MKAPEHYLGEAPVRVVAPGVSGEDMKRERWGATIRAKNSMRRGGLIKSSRIQERKGALKNALNETEP